MLTENTSASPGVDVERRLQPEQFALLLREMKRILSEQAEAIEKASGRGDPTVADQAQHFAACHGPGQAEALASYLERGLEQLQRQVGLLRSFCSGVNARTTIADAIANMESRITGLDLTLRILSQRVEEQGKALNTRLDVSKRSWLLRSSIVLASLLAALVATGIALRFSTSVQEVRSTASVSSGHQLEASAASVEPAGTSDAPAASIMSAGAPISTGMQDSEASSAQTDLSAVAAPVVSAKSAPTEAPNREDGTRASSSMARSTTATSTTGVPRSTSPRASSDSADTPIEGTTPPRVGGVPDELSALGNVHSPVVSAVNSAPSAGTPQEVTNTPSEPTPLGPATTPETRLPSPASPVLLAPMPAAGDSRIILRAKANIWIEVREKHGRILLRRVLHQSETWPVPNRPELLLTTGNAGATELLVDGVIAPPLGAINGIRRDIPLTPEPMSMHNAPVGLPAAPNAGFAETMPAKAYVD